MKTHTAMRSLILAAPLTLLAACGEPSASSRVAETVDGKTAAVEVTDAWCRATPTGARTGACYATLKAVGRDDRLVAVETAAAPTAMVHQMSTDGGVMRMAEHPDGLALPKGQPVSLEPGGSHLMLIGLSAPLMEGQQVALILRFSSGEEVAMQVPVRSGGTS